MCGDEVTDVRSNEILLEVICARYVFRKALHINHTVEGIKRGLVKPKLLTYYSGIVELIDRKSYPL